MMNDMKYKECPKCGRMALDHGKGFKYQCLYRDCLWQGNLAKGDIKHSNTSGYLDSDTIEVNPKQVHFDYLKRNDMLQYYTSTMFDMFHDTLDKALAEKLEGKC